MPLKDFGPFPGMTYLGRQNVDAITNDAAASSKAALTRLVERQSDAATDETTVVSGDAAYADEWKRRQCASVIVKWTIIGAVGVLAAWFFATQVFLDYNPNAPHIAGGRITIAILLSLCGVFVAIEGLYSAIRAFRHGYDGETEEAFRELAATALIIGDRALYVSSQGKDDKRPVVKTVFYDAIGTVDAEPTTAGLDRLVVRSRDGSDIASLLAPATSATDNAHVIVDALNSRLQD
jgi:hypothetical protein